MNKQARTQLNSSPASSQARPVLLSGLLQRQCGCGGSNSFAAGCAGCQNKNVQRKTGERYSETLAQTGVLHEVLPARTEPFDLRARSWPKADFGHHFGSVRVNGAAPAKQVAWAIDAPAPRGLRQPSPALDEAARSRGNDHVGARLPEILLHSAGLREEKLAGQGDSFDSIEAPGGDALQSGGAGPDTLPGAQTGGTNCATATGTTVTEVTNTNPCTKDCSAQHEAKHAADIGPCCTKAGAAYKKAEKQEDKDAIQEKFNVWMKEDNGNYLECRAYDVSVTCADAKHKKLKCEDSPSKDCCVPLVHYIRSARMQRERTCNNAGKTLTDCPFA